MPEVPVQAKRSLPDHEKGLMFEATTHWGRGLAIVLGMLGTVLVFLVLLTLLPKPGSGNPLESIANSVGGSNASVASPVAGVGRATAGAALPTVTAKASGSPGAAGTGTATPRWLYVAPRGVNVRSAANTNNQAIGQLAPGRQVEVIGISADKAWLQIIWDNNQKAWVAQELMQIVSGDAAQLPVIR